MSQTVSSSSNNKLTSNATTASTNINNNDNHYHNGNSFNQDEWVEIVEPKSKTKIYANLNSGACAKHPPEGVTVLKSGDFTDHWWELYDKKTGRHYYYNPEQQKTAWTKPTIENGSNSSRRLLIIPVSKLQTFRRDPPASLPHKEKCDASTQTIASNLVSIGTQTINQSKFVEELSDKLSFTGISNDLSSNKVSELKYSGIIEGKYPYKTYLDHRRLSDVSSKNQSFNSNNVNKKEPEANDQLDRSSQYRPVNHRQHFKSFDNDGDHHRNESPSISYFGPPSSYHPNRRSIHESHGNSTNYTGSLHRNDEHKSSISTFKNPQRSSIILKHDHDSKREQHQNSPHQQTQQVTTNNLTHYLVREAKAMGITLISDDEVDDDDQDSDEDCIVDEDEDTDLRDDLSSHKDASDLNASQELGEDSSEGWKSVSDHGSPTHLIGAHHNQSSSNRQFVQKSPILFEKQASFTYNELIDDRKDPANCRMQQLDHRKLVENFKKSRQASALGFSDSLGRAYKIDANQAVQKIKNVADSYFTNDREKLSDKHIRHLSTISTLPRNHHSTKEPTRDKNSLRAGQLQVSPDLDLDADYDVVEENCSYYSDSDHGQSSLSVGQSARNNGILSSQVVSKKSNEDSHATAINSNFDRNKSTRGSTFSVESFARENLTRHPKKGGLLFNRKVKWTRMISWTKNSIKQPMISSVGSDLNADSIASFKLIQQFMGDRRVTLTKKYRQILSQTGSGLEIDAISSRKTLGRTGSINLGSNASGASLSGSNNSGSSNNSTNNFPDRLRDELAYELAAKGCSKPALRDEILVQLARQLTENPSHESISWGLILMSILFNYFSPSAKFAPFLVSFLDTHPHTMAQDVCLPRLNKRLRQNWPSYCRKPADGKEISIVRLSITKWPQYCGIFGESLDRIMLLQGCSPYLKTLRLPWILTTLGEKLIETGGLETEGIFRCAADQDLLAQLRLEIDCVDFRKITDAKQVKSLLSNVQDPHVIAGLLKLFFRQLYEPVFPPRIYEICLQHCQDGQMACRLFNEHLSNLNKDVVAYLVRLLQSLCERDKVTQTKMDHSNLSMVWAPNLLRMPEPDGCSLLASSFAGDSKTGSKWSISNGMEDDPNNRNHQQQQSSGVPTVTTATPSQSMIFEQTRQEMQFIKSLIINLDTSFIKDVI